MALPACFFLHADLFPAVRTEATLRLRKYGWRQQQIAEALAISQTMVSRYSKCPPSNDMVVSRLAQDVVDSLQGGVTSEASWCASLATARTSDPDRALLSNMLLAEHLLRERPPLDCMPEIGLNIAMAAPGAKSPADVMAFPNRFHASTQGIIGGGPPALGRSNHLAQVILAIQTTYSTLRSVTNIKATPAAVASARRVGHIWRLTGGTEDRLDQIRAAARSSRKAPDWIHDPGAFGVEPCLYVLGPDAVACIDRLREAGIMHAE